MAWNSWSTTAQYPLSGWGAPQAFGAPPGNFWGGQAYTDAYGGNPPVVSHISIKHPSLHPILAIDTTKLRFDVRRSPQSEILTSTFYSTRDNPAKASPTPYLRMICKVFPWTIDINAQTNVTCGMVWQAIHAALQEPLVDSEWGLILQDKKAKERVEAAMKKRMEVDPGSDKRPKRIDYLGDQVFFKGLDRDEEFEKLKLLPHSQPAPETWVIKITS